MRLVVTREMPSLPPELEAVVQQHWTAACAIRRLFNGRVFCADRISPERIEGHWTEYRRVVAQMADHGLVAALGIRSVAVCGVVCGPDGVVVGRREPEAAYQAGLWQLPPAGSVDHASAIPGGASWQQALLKELQEELGLHSADVIGLRPLCLVQHPSGVLDLGVRIGTRLSAAEILQRQKAAPDQEYDALFMARAAAIPAAVAARGGTLVPPAAAFLSRVRATD